MVILFQFVTVRNPRTPSESEISSGFIRPPGEAPTDLLAKTAEARAKGGGAARRVLLRARDTDLAYGSVTGFTERAPRAAAAATWVLQHGPDLTVSELAEFREATEQIDDATQDKSGTTWQS